MIRLDSVSKIYGKRQHEFKALDDVSFKIERGTSVAIIGKSGSGKSTLMHVMSGLDRATSGQIVIDDQDIAKLKNKALDEFRSHKIGFIFQSFFVQANETCLQNVLLPLEIGNMPAAKRKAKALAALKAVDLVDKATTKASNLSGGQKQRLAIARAIAAKPTILFADEPTGNLDSATGKIIEDLLFNYVVNNKATLVVVTHDNDLAKRCDRQITIKDGRLQKGGKQ